MVFKKSVASRRNRCLWKLSATFAKSEPHAARRFGKNWILSCRNAREYFQNEAESILRTFQDPPIFAKYFSVPIALCLIE